MKKIAILLITLCFIQTGYSKGFNLKKKIKKFFKFSKYSKTEKNNDKTNKTMKKIEKGFALTFITVSTVIMVDAVIKSNITVPVVLGIGVVALFESNALFILGFHGKI